MPDVQWNHANWNDHHGWEAGGDEWSVAWGGARAQWYGTILPRLSGFLPAPRVLEIAPGYGRWTQFLLTHCVEYFGVDLSEKCIDVCKRRFSAYTRSRFITNDGASLAAIPDGYIDLVFSFDSLVHAELDVIREYIWQICSKLAPTGTAFLHHSNGLGEACDPNEARRGARAMSVSSALVRQLVEDCGGRVVVQEEINWMGKSRTDCITAFVLATALAALRPVQLLQNDRFLLEAELVKSYQSPYSSPQ